MQGAPVQPKFGVAPGEKFCGSPQRAQEEKEAAATAKAESDKESLRVTYGGAGRGRKGSGTRMQAGQEPSKVNLDDIPSVLTFFSLSRPRLLPEYGRSRFGRTKAGSRTMRVRDERTKMPPVAHR